jgi:hypothetical protein
MFRRRELQVFLDILLSSVCTPAARWGRETHSLKSTFGGFLLQLSHAIFIDVEYSIVRKSELVGWTAREEQQNQ